MDKTALSYWFPRLEAAGLPVPKTKILAMPREFQEAMFAAMDGKDGGATTQFRVDIEAAGDEVGWPCFLRTDHTSGKHNWENTCYLTDKSEIMQHVWNLVEFSEIVDIMGLPWNVWAVRELLPTIPLGICKAYGNMPVCREFRFFVEDDVVRCVHPYWPKEALEQGDATQLDYELLCCVPDLDFYLDLFDLASRAGKAVGGAWSVDILETQRGWFVTDLAEAHKSFHWEGCPHDARMGKREAD